MTLTPLLQAFFIIALAAASVASQAMISGAFQIIKQSIALGCFPRVTIKNLSPNVSDTLTVTMSRIPMSHHTGRV